MRIRHLIDGKEVDSCNHFETLNPATQEVLAEVASGGEAEVNAAVAAAKAAFPKWAGLPATERAKLVRKLGDLIAMDDRPGSVLDIAQRGFASSHDHGGCIADCPVFLSRQGRDLMFAFMHRVNWIFRAQVAGFKVMTQMEFPDSAPDDGANRWRLDPSAGPDGQFLR